MKQAAAGAAIAILAVFVIGDVSDAVEVAERSGLLTTTASERDSSADKKARIQGDRGEGEPIRASDWQAPPLQDRPTARWWWPGGSVDAEQVRTQLEQIRAAGFGAVELQPLLLGLGSADIAVDARLRSVGTSGFHRRVADAAAVAGELGLAFDFTLGSGWPGGLPTPKANAERQLLMASVDVTGPLRFRGPLPAAPDQSYRRAVEWILDVLGPPDPDVTRVAVTAARLGGSVAGVPTLSDARVLFRDGTPVARDPDWALPEGEWRVFVFYENSTEHFVMGGAYPGAEKDARVVDHLSERGANALIEGYAAPVLAALPAGTIRDVFVDSFELMGELPTTGQFLAEFQAQHGYDLTPHLPIVFRRGGESKYGEMLDIFGRDGGPRYGHADSERGARIREDYEAVRARLFEDRFIGGLQRWVHAHGARLRLQAHGGYGDYLDIYARADIPESEGLFGGGSFDFLKLAASAAHVGGRRYASSESFITLRLLGTRLSEDEMRLLAGRAYSAGINRLAFHGVPYPYKRADGDDWYPFSGGFGRILAGPLPMSSRIDSDFLAELSDFNRFLSRLTLVMSAGEPAADVAWLHSARSHPDAASLQLGRIEPHAGESDTTRALRSRGLVHDRISRRMLTSAVPMDREFTVGSGRYRALLLDPLEVAEPELLEQIAAIAGQGVPVLALGGLPERAPGLRDAAARDARVRAALKRLAPYVIRVPQPEALEDILARHVRGAVVEPEPGSRLSVSLERRRTAGGDTLLVFNESWSAQTARLRFLRAGGILTRWDPRSGRRTQLRERVEAGEGVVLELEPAETLLLTLGRPPLS